VTITMAMKPMPILVVPVELDSFLVAVNKEDSKPMTRRKVGSVPLRSQVANNDVALRAFFILLGLHFSPRSRPQHPRLYCAQYSFDSTRIHIYLKRFRRFYHSLCPVPFISENGPLYQWLFPSSSDVRLRSCFS